MGRRACPQGALVPRDALAIRDGGPGHSVAVTDETSRNSGTDIDVVDVRVVKACVACVFSPPQRW